ncbi:MAG: hypothetical protein VKN33_08355 [Candidatus Sericytochromatia bacterium]|nr:hypothetical protein [Candidatus Sericytochromatia bacterium]
MSETLSLSLDEVSVKLGVSPSAVKKRIAHLNIPVMRGARGKLIFDQYAFGLLAEADGLLKAGHGFEECRQRLGLQLPASIDVEAEDLEGEADDETGSTRRLPTPVFVQLRRKKSAQSPNTSIPLPDLIARLDSLLKLLDEKERHNQMLQAKLMVAYDEITKLSATAAAHQERTLALQVEVQRLSGELKMLDAPDEFEKPWWRFW